MARRKNSEGEITLTDVQKAVKEFTVAIQKYERQNRAFHKVLLKRIDSGLLSVQKMMHAQEGTLNRAEDTNKTVESTLIHVLLAIRQNEYLQAWYPQTQKEINGAH